MVVQNRCNTMVGIYLTACLPLRYADRRMARMVGGLEGRRAGQEDGGGIDVELGSRIWMGTDGSEAEKMDGSSPACHPSMPQAEVDLELERYGAASRYEATEEAEVEDASGGGRMPLGGQQRGGGVVYSPAARMQGAAVLGYLLAEGLADAANVSCGELEVIEQVNETDE